MSSISDQLVVLDGRVDDEKLAELLGIQTEHPQLDFKQEIDVTTTRGLIEFTKDVGAFQVRGGYILGGVDGQGVPNGSMDGCDARRFDEANLKPKLLKYLPEPLTVHTRVTEWEGRSPDGPHTVVIVYIEPNPDGCAVFKAGGQYDKPGKPQEKVIVFRKGDIFWRNGTSSERVSHEGFREIVRRQVEREKTEWMKEQDELRRRDREQIEAGREARSLAEAPVGTMNLGLPADELRLGVLELARANDTIGLLWLLNDARPRAQAAIERDEIDSELADLLDKLAVIGGACIEFEQDDLLERVVGVFREIYLLPLGEPSARGYSYSTAINPQEKGPRVFLAVLLRIYGLGALAVRLHRWEVVRLLTLQPSDLIDDYWTNWLRHGLTMASRADQFSEQQPDGRKVQLSLLTLSAQVIEQQPALHPDTRDDEEILTSLAQFDFLSNLVAIDAAGSPDDKDFYTSWGRFRQKRIQPIADRLLSDPDLRRAIFRGDDQHLAAALLEVGKMAHQEGIRYFGFSGWDRTTPVGEFIVANSPTA